MRNYHHYYWTSLSHSLGSKRPSFSNAPSICLFSLPFISMFAVTPPLGSSPNPGSCQCLLDAPGIFHSNVLLDTGEWNILTKWSINQLCPDCCWVQMGSNNQCDHVVHSGEPRPPGGQGNKQEHIIGSQLSPTKAQGQRFSSPGEERNVAQSQNK